MMVQEYNKSIVFWAACAGMLLFGISFITLGAVTVPLREKFILDDVAAGTLFAILPMGIILGSMLFGPIADRYGYKLLFVISTFLLFAGFMGIAYAPSLGLLKVCIFIFGFGGGALNGSTNAVVSLISEGNKVGRLSLLGVFYGIGALGMPAILGSLQSRFSYQDIVAFVSILTIVTGIVFLCIRFPTAQRAQAISFRAVTKIFDKNLIIFVAAFLFLQMSLEAIVNNWTTTYLQSYRGIAESNALYGLSLYISGMTVMRILIGSVFRKSSEKYLLTLSLILILSGALILLTSTSFVSLAVSLVVLGAGMSAGVPLMLAIVGNLFKEMAGTAFSVVIVIGLLGNLSLNYVMGLVAEHYGIAYFAYGILMEWSLMAILGFFIIRSLKHHKIN